MQALLEGQDARMSASKQSNISRLAALLRRYNAIGDTIAGVIGRPAERGHVGEYIAASIFDITLERSARKRARDGRFMAGALAGRTVNVKWYGKQEGVLDLHARGAPDYYLALTGPAGSAASSRGTTRTWMIQCVYLFDARRLLEDLRARGVKRLRAATLPAADTQDRSAGFTERMRTWGGSVQDSSGASDHPGCPSVCSSRYRRHPRRLWLGGRSNGTLPPLRRCRRCQ